MHVVLMMALLLLHLLVVHVVPRCVRRPGARLGMAWPPLIMELLRCHHSSWPICVRGQGRRP